jgi:hypothetical protein
VYSIPRISLGWVSFYCSVRHIIELRSQVKVHHGTAIDLGRTRRRRRKREEDLTERSVLRKMKGEKRTERVQGRDPGKRGRRNRIKRMK